ncbi:hypothetical protein ACHAPU_006510 [Fusarium lateritium]
MSSRQLRKVQRQRELEKIHKITENESEESGEEQLPVVTKPRVSLFAALGGEVEDEDEAKDETEEEQQPEEDVTEVKPPPATSKSKKKKKNKKSKAKNAKSQQVEDEIDKAIKELNLATSKSGLQPTSENTTTQSMRINKLLEINPYHLKAINEMRNVFGRDVMESTEVEGEQENRRRRQDQARQEVDIETFLRSPPNAPKLPEVSLRRNLFIQGREHWPKQSAGGLTMKEIGKAEDGSATEYAYVHENTYDAMQSCFFGCVQIGDPMRMIHLLREAPYHVSTLLQVSSMAKQDQNMSFASELLERALFTFGRVTTSAFRQNIEQGKARLDFRRPENRQIWLAGYHYIKSLIRKGTNRTALEWAKLLYSFDPKDPYAMRHFIHSLAIRAQEAGWLIDFLDELEETSDNRDTIYLRQTLVLAHLQLGDTARATEELEKGMKRVPWLYCALFQALNLDTPPSIWGKNADSDSRSFWEKLYIHQAKDIWNNTQAIALLEKVAKSLDKVDTSALPSTDSPPDQGVTRLAFLDGQTSLLGLAPREYLQMQPNYEFDPMPPPEVENIFSGTGTRLPWQDQGQDQGVTPEIQARLQHLFQRRGAAPRGMALDGEGDSDDDAEQAAMLDDEELRRDLEEAARSNGTGFLGRLMQMLGVITGPTDERPGADQEGETDTETEDEDETSNEVVQGEGSRDQV